MMTIEQRPSDKRRLIAHVDMDAFYASIEQRDDPSLKGKPVIVGGTGPRGVVAAASYESRVFGIHSAMPVRDARRRCAELICIRPRMARYRAESAKIFQIFNEFTPLVEGLSLDEAFLDLSEIQAAFDGPRSLGRAIKDRIRADTDLIASVGIAPNKLVAKIASDLDKPDGLCTVAAEKINDTLDPLPIRKLFGVGPATAKQLAEIGVSTFAELRDAKPACLRPIFGRYVARMQARASGIDTRPVMAVRDDKSISSEETFDDDLARWDELLRHLNALADETAARLRRRGLIGAVVQVKIREADFTTHTRQKSFRPASNETNVIRGIARELLAQWWRDHPRQPLRLLGVGVSSLHGVTQMDLFDAGAGCQLSETVDRIHERFGADALTDGRNLR